MELAGKKRKKILFLFLFGIGLPSLLLGYFAFRGIQNDQALLEKRQLDDHQRAAEQVVSTIDQSISDMEQTFIQAFSDQENSEEPRFLRSLQGFKNRYPLVEEAFLFRNADEIHFPGAELLFLSDGSFANYSGSSKRPSQNQIFFTAQKLEFQEKNYKKALLSYQTAMDQTNDRQIKGECLSAIARVQKKTELLEEAIESYKKISEEYSQVRIADGIPLDLAARLELGSLYQESGNILNAIKTHIELYRSLSNREWRLEQPSYVYFSQQVNNCVQDILSQESLPSEIAALEETYQDLLDEEQDRREQTERLLLFQERAAPDIQAKMAPNIGDSENSVKRRIVEIGRDVYLVSLFGLNQEKRRDSQDRWGILLNASYLKDPLLLNSLQNHLPTEKSSWIVKGREGHTVLASENVPSGSLIVRTDFKRNFPDWILEFYHQEPPLFETFLTSRRGIYFYMFLLIAGILVFGLFLTVRTVSHELELARMKSDFVSAISHEFKSPLTSIRQLAEMLHSGRVPSEERRQKYYDVLLEQSERLSLLTENVLNFAKMEEGRKEFVFEKTDIKSLLEDLVSSIQERVRHAGFEVQLEIENSLPLIMVDSETLIQAVNNVIDNAIKYSGDVKKVEVRAFKKDRNAVITVQDFGVGIGKEEKDKIFERFYRGGDELTRTVKGSGLGLTLVKQIVDAHKGSVQVESEPGQGSTFSIKLPLEDTEIGKR
jgi:signal transduction histidine kinase/tetratricopeptide (TPR) repeat protein